jgi:two-component system, OmpR family, alkaline phosphatase synthesis response regulator PhoP
MGHRSITVYPRRDRRPARVPVQRSPMPSVLIVDDEQHIRLLIEQALEELEDDGVELLTAPDGEVALEVVRNQAPDLVFLDVTMPKLNGFDACDRIKHELGMTDTFVCMLTAKGQAYDRERGLEAGADLFMTKPFDPDELLAIARRALHLDAGEE